MASLTMLTKITRARHYPGSYYRNNLERLLDVKAKGPYIKDVRTGRGEGGIPKADIVREVAWIYFIRLFRSIKNLDKGEGVKKPENFAEVLYV